MPAQLPPASVLNKYALLFQWGIRSPSEIWIRVLFLEGNFSTQQAQLFLDAHQGERAGPISDPAAF